MLTTLLKKMQFLITEKSFHGYIQFFIHTKVLFIHTKNLWETSLIVESHLIEIMTPWLYSSTTLLSISASFVTQAHSYSSKILTSFFFHHCKRDLLSTSAGYRLCHSSKHFDLALCQRQHAAAGSRADKKHILLRTSFNVRLLYSRVRAFEHPVTQAISKKRHAWRTVVACVFR